VVIYQLPNGKIVRLTIDEYLYLTDDDINYLMSIDYGESANNPWIGSCLPYNSKNLSIEYYEDDSDVSLPDFNSLDDDAFDVPDDVDY